MRLPSVFYQIEQTLQQQFPALRPAQHSALTLWVYGTLLAQNACQNAVLTALQHVGSWHNLRQRLRELLYDGEHKAAPCHTQIDVSACCLCLARWFVRLWTDNHLVLALDATGHRDCLTVLTLSVVYRGSAIPLFWTALPGNQKGAWNPHWQRMLTRMHSVVPEGWSVLVLCDRGLWSPDIYQHIGVLGWHPLMRVRNNMCFTPQGHCRVPALALLGGVGHAWIGAGTAFTGQRQLKATLVALWLDGQHEPCLVLTNLPPAQVGVGWYGLRMWIEAGFRLLKSGGWQWHKTRRTDCERASRHWVVLAIATLWTLSAGTRLETVPDDAWRPRRVSVFRAGLMALPRQLHQGRLGKRLALRPFWPPSPTDTLETVIYHPPDTS